MIYFDVTKMGAAKHRSGLMRVSGRLRDELGARVQDVVWRERAWQRADGNGQARVGLKPEDWVLTAELFCEAERPGLWEFLRAKPCRVAATFNDAIPISHPHITWPQSVSRHPEYMKMLAAFDRVAAAEQAGHRADARADQGAALGAVRVVGVAGLARVGGAAGQQRGRQHRAGDGGEGLFHRKLLVVGGRSMPDLNARTNYPHARGRRVTAASAV